MLQLRQMGGALARATPGAGARATLVGDVSMFALGAVFDEPMREAVHTALADIDVALQPYGAGHYLNFVEEPADASAFFVSGHLGAPAGGQGRPMTPPTCSSATTTSRPPRLSPPRPARRPLVETGVVGAYAAQRKPVASGRGASGLAGRPPGGSSSL